MPGGGKIGVSRERLWEVGVRGGARVAPGVFQDYASAISLTIAKELTVTVEHSPSRTRSHKSLNDVSRDSILLSPA